MTLFITENDVSKLLSMDIALEAVEDGLRHQAKGEATNSPRARIRLPNGTFNFMSAAEPTLGLMGVKTYGVIEHNEIHFYVQLYSTKTGKLMAIIEATRMGQIRTGAATGVATKYMARDNATKVGIIGSGYQAVTQLEAVCKVRNITEAMVFSRTPERRQQFVDAIKPKLGINITSVESAEACVNEADIVITITPASKPVLNGHWLKPGTHINAAGGNHWMRREVDDETVRRASVIVVDDLEQAKLECGDLIYPIENGIIRWQQTHNICDLVAGTIPGRTNDKEITLFESQGLALEDISTGALIYQKARDEGIGMEISM